MSEVGSLYIKMSAETAELRGDLGKVKQQLEALSDGAATGGEGIDASMTKARGSMMLLETATGVRLPRALNTLIATIPGVASAFQLMLPLAGVAAAIAVIGKVIEAHEKMAAAIRKAADESNNQTIKEEDQSKALELTNLKLDDQIAKLEHKPSHNYMREAMLETSEEIDKLAASFAADFEKMNAVISDHLTFWSELKETAWETIRGTLASAVASTLIQKDALTSLQQKMTDVEISRRKMAEAPLTDASQKASQVELLNRLQAQQKAFDYAAATYGDNKELLLQFSTAAASTANEIKNLNQEIEAGSKKKVIAGLDQMTASLEPLKQEAELFKIVQGEATKASEALKVHQDAVARLSEMKDEGNNDPAKKYEAQHAYNDAVYGDALDNAERLKQIATDLFNKEYAANADNKKKQAELEKSFNAEIANIKRSEVAALDELNQKTLSDWLAAEEKKKQLAVELSKSFTNLAQETTKRQEAAMLEGVKAGADANSKAHALGLESERQFIEAKIALAKQEQKIKVDALNAEIEAQQKAANTAGGAGNQVAQNEALAKRVQLQAQLNTLTGQYASELSTLGGDLQKLNSSWATYFGKMKVETQDLSTQIRTKLQSSVNEFETSFANSMAKCIIENKSLGQAVRQEAAQMGEAMISMLVQWLEKWIVSHIMASTTGTATNKAAQLSAASLAGANMTASYAAAPWPIDMGAPAAGAAAMAAAMSFEIGGKIPGVGPVPITAHGGESVVQKVLTDRVERAESRGGVGNGNGGGEVHLHFSPQIHAMDATDVDRVLTKHSSTFERHFRAATRRMNK